MEELRKKIDEIDLELVRLFENRFNLVKQVANKKTELNLQTENKQRESEILEKRSKEVTEELSPYIKEFFIDLFRISKKYQDDIRGKKK